MTQLLIEHEDEDDDEDAGESFRLLFDRLQKDNEIQEIVRQFSYELLEDAGDPITEFHFGCTADRIEWDDQDFSHMEIAPRVIISFDFEELGEGRFNALTPEGISRLLFAGRYRRRVGDALRTALRLERERVAVDIESELHIPEIRKHMQKARNAILASFRFAMSRMD